MVNEILGKACEVSAKCNRSEVVKTDKIGMRFATSGDGSVDLARNPTARPCRCEELEARLQRVEELALANRRELDLQFRRMADLQAAFDSPMANGRRRQENGKSDGKADGFR
jgi:hypothetical protein